ncbi:MAG: amidase family protein [Gemmatimonadales bacterium]
MAVQGRRSGVLPCDRLRRRLSARRIDAAAGQAARWGVATADLEVADLSACELRRKIERREISPVELVQACLDRVEAHGERLNAVVTLNERAVDEAREAEASLARGEPAGPLFGLPVGIKDVTPVAGLRTTYGSPLFADHIAVADALVVRRLKRAGAIVLGKTNTPEFAAGANTFNPVFGPTRNPWDPALSAVGSTGGGAAALASGMIALAEGTDLGGSLRVPAAFCGVVGLRPSAGFVPTYPSYHLWDTLQATGGMARTAEDLALMMEAVAGPSPHTPINQPGPATGLLDSVRRLATEPVDLRLAYCPDIAAIGVNERVEETCRAAAFDLCDERVSVEEVALDLSFAREAFLTLRGYWMVAHHHALLDRLDLLGDNLAGNIRAGLESPPERLGAAERDRSRLWERMGDLFQHFDALLTPCVAVPPFPVEENHPSTIGGRQMNSYIDWIAPTFLLSLSGLPAASVPAGLDPSGLPVGLQIAAGPFGEAMVLGLAARVQEKRPIGLPELPGS